MIFGVSVIICCYNSEKRISETLKHLACQVVPDDIQWEVVLVNNCSTDNTVKVATEAWERYGSPATLRIIEEKIPGLSYAREAGIDAANYEYIIFCDDDNWLDENYLTAAYKIMYSNPRIGLAGGFGKAKCEVSPPSWFEKKKGGYAVSIGNEPTGDITDHGHLCGAGMVLRKSVIKHFYDAGFKSLLTDRNGTALSSGGDSEISKWHILAGYRLWNDSTLQFVHFIPKERLTEDYVKKLWEGFNLAAPIILAYDQYIAFLNEKKMKSLLRILIENLFVVLKAIVTRTKHSNLYTSIQHIQLCLNGLFVYNKNLDLVQKMLSGPTNYLLKRGI